MREPPAKFESVTPKARRVFARRGGTAIPSFREGGLRCSYPAAALRLLLNYKSNSGQDLYTN